MKYEKLFAPGQIGNLQLKNRLVMPPMGTGYPDRKGFVSERLKRYHRERALGGAGLIITEVTSVVYGMPNALHIADDGYIPGLAELAGTIHEGGAKAALQLWHMGLQRESFKARPEIVGAWSRNFHIGEVARPLEVEEIQKIVASFAAGAVRAREAGFDAVEIHGAHEYLVAQFLSGITNRREDEYGGSLENRARFLLEILRAIRKAVGRDYPVWFRMNGAEFGIRRGNTIADTKQVAQWAVEAGADAVHVSAIGLLDNEVATLSVQPAILVPLAAEIKRVVPVPVITVGRMDHDAAEKALAEGQADFVSMGRRVIADPRIHQKVAAGAFDEINPCIACNECIDFVGIHKLRCSVNPAVGTEHESGLPPAATSKRVVVVGGGPAGLEAATVAARRGHRVTLVERSATLGGQLTIGIVPPHKEDMAKQLDYLVRQARQAGVELVLDTVADLNYLRGLAPDAVVFATGAAPRTLRLPGFETARVVLAAEVLGGTAEVGGPVVVVGGGTVGCETALYLAEKGTPVTVVEMLKELAPTMGGTARMRLLGHLAAAGVATFTSTKVEAVREGQLGIVLGDGESRSIAVDTIVLATGYAAEASLYKEAEGQFAETHLIGDAVEARKLGDALRDGLRVGVAL